MSTSAMWNGISVKAGATFAATNAIVSMAEVSVSATGTDSATPATVSLSDVALSGASTCLSLQGPVRGYFRGSVRDCESGIKAEQSFDAIGVDWGDNKGPDPDGGGRPSLVGDHVSVYPWVGAPSIAAPETPGVYVHPPTDECADYLFIGVRGSGEMPTFGNMGDFVETIREEFTADVATYRPGTKVRAKGIEYPANPVPIGDYWPLLADYVPGAWQGAVELLATIEKEQERCAGTGEQIVISGYSQGAWAVHASLTYADLSPRIDMTRIAAVGLLADPQRLPHGLETQLGSALPSTTGILNIGHIGGAVYGFSDWLAGATDPAVRQWQLDSNAPISSMLYMNSIPESIRKVTASYCNRHDPVCGFGDNPSDISVHSYSVQSRQDLGRWMARTAEHLQQPLTNVIGVAGGGWGHALALRADGTVWGFGRSEIYGGEDYGPFPRPIVGLSDIKAVAAGGSVGYALKNDGTVWAWGSNDVGQLGNGRVEYEYGNVPSKIPGLSDVVAVAAGHASAYALKSDGTVWAWGDNTSGQLGEGSLTSRSTPTRALALANVKAIAGGSARNGYALLHDGTVWSWGDNEFGQLGDGTTAWRSVPSEVPGLSDVTSISAGYWTAYAVKADGTAWGYGANTHGQMGLGFATQDRVLLPVQIPELSNVQSMAAGQFSAYALLSDGTGRAWGEASWGQLGDGVPRVSWSWPVAVSGLSDLVAISGRPDSAYALRADGTLWSWGRNSGGQLGDGTYDLRRLPVRVGG
ncbi:RCC1 domain-containing protein [Paenarthrobacter nitroguajacolicus]|uniref:RCC1 domain-containing protein n=1 Tax=Paenarthrobacter nitroguajacolicus TaxID=211146 RepID=UPI001FB9CE35|nr:cutinase family protein [Paenarthrobacter nitroguajacolicus]